MEGKKPVCKPKCDCRKDQTCEGETCICKNGAKSDDCSKECPGIKYGPLLSTVHHVFVLKSILIIYRFQLRKSPANFSYQHKCVILATFQKCKKTRRKYIDLLCLISEYKQLVFMASFPLRNSLTLLKFSTNNLLKHSFILRLALRRLSLKSTGNKIGSVQLVSC
jgi:hypothetical protein